MKDNRQVQMAAVFNEWARRYAKNPDAFSPFLDADGKPVEDYGESCALYYAEIDRDLHETPDLCQTSADRT